MTTRPTAKSILVIGAALAMTAAAVYITLAAWHRGGAIAPRFDRMVGPSPHVADQPDAFAALLQGSKPGELLMNAGAQPLDANPADLPDPPSGKRLLGYRMVNGDLAQEVVVWSIDKADPDALATFYDTAAAQAGFASPAVYRPDDRTLTHVYKQGPRLLTLRFARRADAVRMVIHLGYTIDNPPPRTPAGETHHP